MGANDPATSELSHPADDSSVAIIHGCSLMKADDFPDIPHSSPQTVNFIHTMQAEVRPSEPLLGTVLVAGGCGFFGFHLVRQLLDDEECGAVYVIDRRIQEVNLHEGANYVAGSITDFNAVDALVKRIKPRVIFHAASPNVTFQTHGKGDFYETNVKGTELLLTIAAESESIRALVFTSSVDVYADPPHDNVDETHPLWEPIARTSDYNLTKAIAERLVRTANSPQLRTATIIPAHMYGVRDSQALPLVLDTVSGNRPLVQIGRGENFIDVVSADNAASAHLLAAKALVDPSRAQGKVDGEAFNVSDGSPVLFWHHVRQIWKGARGEGNLRHAIVVPAWAMIFAVYLVELVLRIFTLGLMRPPQTMDRTSLSYTLQNHTYNIQKVKERLGFCPIAKHDEVVDEAVRWELDRREHLAKKG